MVQPYIPDKRSALDTISKGLSVVQSIAGIKSTYDQMKINEKKQELLQQEEEQQKRRDLGEFTEKELSEVYQVEPETKGSMVGWVQKIERTPTGKIIYDTETNQPKTKREKFYYITKDQAQIQSYLDKQSDYAQKLDEMKIRSMGGVPKSDIMSGRLKNFSLMPKTGAVKSFYIEPETQQRVDIWISPIDAKSISGGGAGGDSEIKFPEWTKKSSDLTSGYSAAIRAGIKNPTEKDALDYSPTNIQRNLDKYDSDIKKEDYDIAFALKRVDDLIGIDAGENGSPSDQIPGVTDVAGYIPTTGMFGIAGRMTLSDKQRENLAAIDAVLNPILLERSGAAVTPQEYERLKSELNLAYGKRDAAAVRRVIGEVRDKLRAWIEQKSIKLPPSAKQTLKENPNVLSPYSPIFKKKSDLSDEEAADRFMGGKK